MSNKKITLEEYRINTKESIRHNYDNRVDKRQKLLISNITITNLKRMTLSTPQNVLRLKYYSFPSNKR